MKALESLKKLSRIRSERERISRMRSIRRRSQLEQAETGLTQAHAMIDQIDIEGRQSVTAAFEELTASRNPEQRVDAMLRSMRALEKRKDRAAEQLKRAETRRKAAQIGLSSAIAEHGAQKRALDALDQTLKTEIAEAEIAQENEETEMIAELAILAKMRQSDV